jgi:hypothetical protein
MGKEMKDLSAQIEPITKLLGSDFANKVPTNVVQKDRDKLADFQARTKEVEGADRAVGVEDNHGTSGPSLGGHKQTRRHRECLRGLLIMKRHFENPN